MKQALVIVLLVLNAITAWAQGRKVQNRPYTDLRPFHFGIHIGTHLQDTEFNNIGPQIVVAEDGTTSRTFITCDQDRLEPGFNVGVLGEFRLSEHLQLRIAPAIYFGSRHLTFHEIPQPGEEQKEEMRQNVKTAYITSTFDLIFAAPRCNNHRAYMFVGMSPALNLTGKATDYVRLKPYQTFVELGFGFDQYLPFFKCRPELKFMFGLGDALKPGHADELRDKTLVSLANSVNSAHTKMITLSFFFE